MTPYQRGNRDGLRSMAGAFRHTAQVYRASAKKHDENGQRLGIPLHAIRAAKRLHERDLTIAVMWENAADRLEVAAMALPEDPEDQP